MVYEQRWHQNYFSGTLALAASVSDTTLSSTAFAALPTGYSTTIYQPIVLHNPASGIYEIAWITGHAANSQTVTVARGRESTTAQAWPANTQIIDAATANDMLGAYGSRSILPASNMQTGYRASLVDENVTVEKTVNGWLPSVGVAAPADVGPVLSSMTTFPPANSVIMVRAGRAQGAANVSGDTSFSYRTPFPTNTIAVTITSAVYDTLGPFVVYGADKNGFSFRSFGASSNPVANGTLVYVNFVAVGY